MLGVREAAPRRRVALDDTSWVEHVPRWVTDDQALFQLLAKAAGWEQRTRWMFERHVIEPRLTAEYPVLASAPEPLRAVGARLSSSSVCRSIALG